MKKSLTIISALGLVSWFIISLYLSITPFIVNEISPNLLKMFSITFFVWLIPALVIKMIEMGDKKSDDQTDDTKPKKSCAVCKKKSKNGNV